ncbi:hypothetical protein ACFL6L_04610, partial [candidate division KSB1 bacterium]
NVITVPDLEKIEEHLCTARILLTEANILEKAGIDILKTLKETHPNVAIVVMGTAWTSNESKEQFVKNYADALVYKPFDVSRISRIISQLNINNIISHTNAL